MVTVIRSRASTQAWIWKGFSEPLMGRVRLTARQLRLFRALMLCFASLPIVLLGWEIALGELGPDPGKTLTRALGMAGLQTLFASLAMAPLQKLTGFAGWVQVRRMLGLFAFFYVSLHLLAYLQFISGWSNFLLEVTERPFITVGFLAWLLMAPLALTSTKAMMRRLGRRWKTLHRLVYIIALLGFVHFLWQARSNLGEFVLYGLILTILLGARIYWAWNGARERG